MSFSLKWVMGALAFLTVAFSTTAPAQAHYGHGYGYGYGYGYSNGYRVVSYAHPHRYYGWRHHRPYRAYGYYGHPHRYYGWRHHRPYGYAWRYHPHRGYYHHRRWH